MIIIVIIIYWVTDSGIHNFSENHPLDMIFRL